MRLGILQYRSSPPKEVRVLHRTTHPPLKSEPTNVAEGLPLPFQALGQVGKTNTPRSPITKSPPHIITSMDRPDKASPSNVYIDRFLRVAAAKVHLHRPRSPPKLHRPSPSDASAWGRRNYVVIAASSPRGLHAVVPSGVDQPSCPSRAVPYVPPLLICPSWV